MPFDVARIEEKISHVVAAETEIDARQGGVMLNTMLKAYEMAKVMAVSKGMVPPHCRGEPGVCMGITMRAIAWDMDPWAVATQTYTTKPDAPVSWMAMLIHAVINTRAGLKKRLNFEFLGEGPTRQIRVIGTFEDGEVREYLSPQKKDIKVKNSPLWEADLDQQLSYYGVRAWGRRWVPEVLLGVYTKDEIEDGESVTFAADVTPKMPPRLTGKPAKARKGFNPGKALEIADQAQGRQKVTPQADQSAPPIEQTEATLPGIASSGGNAPAVA
jgi:RecT family